MCHQIACFKLFCLLITKTYLCVKKSNSKFNRIKLSYKTSHYLSNHLLMILIQLVYNLIIKKGQNLCPFYIILFQCFNLIYDYFFFDLMTSNPPIYGCKHFGIEIEPS